AIMGIPAPVVSDLVTGKRRITTKIARALADAFGNDPEEWVKLQAIYDVTSEALKQDDLTARKSKVWHKVPVRLGVNRGWLVDSENIDTLEAQVLDLYGVSKLEDITPKTCAARKSSEQDSLTNEQLFWFVRARRIAECLPLKSKYNRATFPKLLD